MDNDQQKILRKGFGAFILPVAVQSVLLGVAEFFAIWIPYHAGESWRNVFVLDDDKIATFGFTSFSAFLVIAPGSFLYFVLVRIIFESKPDILSRRGRQIGYLLNTAAWVLLVLFHLRMNFDLPPYYAHEAAISSFIAVPVTTGAMFIAGLITNAYIFWSICRLDSTISE